MDPQQIERWRDIAAWMVVICLFIMTISLIPYTTGRHAPLLNENDSLYLANLGWYTLIIAFVFGLVSFLIGWYLTAKMKQKRNRIL